MKDFLQKNWFYMLLLLGALLFPLGNPGGMVYRMVTMCCIFSIATLSLNLILGYTRQASLAHGAFFGIGAYTVGILTKNMELSYWLALPLAALGAAFIGFLIGFLTLRTKGSYFAIRYLSFGMVVYIIAQQWVDLTGGNTGLPGVPRPDSIPLPFGAELDFATPISRYYLVLFFLLLTLLVMHRVVNSLQGYSFMAIRNNESLAEVVGINTFRNKLLAFVVANFFVGIAGGLYAMHMRALYPGVCAYSLSFEFIIYLLLGGAATLAGPILGTFVVYYLIDTLQVVGQYQYVIFGLLLILVIKYFPRGLMGALTGLGNRIKSLNRRRKEGAKDVAKS